MTAPKKITIMYFSDILCIWAYLAQIRIDELNAKFGNDIALHYHFVQVFGSVESKMEKSWKHRGGVSAYSQHVQKIASEFDHIDIHPEAWVKNTPTTSASCHLFLKAIQLLEAQDELPRVSEPGDNHRSTFEATVWELRLAFFRDLMNISELKTQMEIAERLGLPRQKIQHQIDSGSAFAAMDRDAQIKEKYRVTGSPTLVLNEGRQILYGNVGYRVIEANIQELLDQDQSRVSWC